MKYKEVMNMPRRPKPKRKVKKKIKRCPHCGKPL